MFDKLQILKKKGYCPDAILDIGAHVGDWTNNMKHIYNECKYYLFEPNDYQELKRFRNDDNVKVFNVILNETKTDVKWYSINGTGDSIFKEKSHHYIDCDFTIRRTTEINSIVLEFNILEKSNNIFIKIDCQGSEISILKGANNILNRTDFIVLEIPLFGQYNEGVSNFLEHISFMNDIGFVVYDIIDNHYINDFNMQIDVLFINKNHMFNNIVNDLLLVKK